MKSCIEITNVYRSISFSEKSILVTTFFLTCVASFENHKLAHFSEAYSNKWKCTKRKRKRSESVGPAVFAF